MAAAAATHTAALDAFGATVGIAPADTATPTRVMPAGDIPGAVSPGSDAGAGCGAVPSAPGKKRAGISAATRALAEFRAEAATAAAAADAEIEQLRQRNLKLSSVKNTAEERARELSSGLATLGAKYAAAELAYAPLEPLVQRLGGTARARSILQDALLAADGSSSDAAAGTSSGDESDHGAATDAATPTEPRRQRGCKNHRSGPAGIAAAAAAAAAAADAAAVVGDADAAATAAPAAIDDAAAAPADAAVAATAPVPPQPTPRQSRSRGPQPPGPAPDAAPPPSHHATRSAQRGSGSDGR
jgi:hypothetical protein